MGIVQLLLLVSLATFVAAPIVLVASAVEYLRTRTRRRALIVAACFHAGALVAAWTVWSLRPSGWALPFWTTVRAGMDARTYGHVVEHAAEVLVTLVVLAALAGGVAAAGGALVGMRRTRTSLHRM